MGININTIFINTYPAFPKYEIDIDFNGDILVEASLDKIIFRELLYKTEIGTDYTNKPVKVLNNKVVTLNIPNNKSIDILIDSLNKVKELRAKGENDGNRD